MGRGGKTEVQESLQSGIKKLLEVTDTFIILTVVTASQGYVCIKTHQVEEKTVEMEAPRICLSHLNNNYTDTNCLM